MYLILALILIGLVAGGLAERVVYPEWKIDWTEAFIVGIAGSLLGGILGSLLAGDGFDLAFSGIIGSILGAIILLAILKWVRGRIRAHGK
ncbi:MAG TPA: GlsB/YeaQ/YmgE family stress response membrane protein [Acidimicrobiia bacterium]|nr:GlsB/YeaQ/YmgE family stress response membrane protein [Acidimicrobiia bacterium]